jgi:hypothetical protein
MGTDLRGKPDSRALSILVALLFLATLVVNALANILPINGRTTGEVSDALPNLFVPAGLTFSIWGLIYLLLAGAVTAGVLEAFRKDRAPAWGAIDYTVIAVNLAANCGWILAWHYGQVGRSLVLMLVILASLVFLEERRYAAPKTEAQAPGLLRRFFLSTPLNVYLGWICVATIANATALLVSSGWEGFGLDPRAWTVVVIAAGLAVGLVLAFARKAVAAPLVVVWAYAGIVIKRVEVDPVYSRPVWIAALAASVLLVAAVAMVAARQRPAAK